MVICFLLVHLRNFLEKRETNPELSPKTAVSAENTPKPAVTALGVTASGVTADVTGVTGVTTSVTASSGDKGGITEAKRGAEGRSVVGVGGTPNSRLRAPTVIESTSPERSRRSTGSVANKISGDKKQRKKHSKSPKKRTVRGKGKRYVNLPLFDVAAVHIDYGNRRESRNEAKFVASWCASRNIELRVRTITEAKRGVTKRDLYERLTRGIRYSAYKAALLKTGAKAVVFGHHRGDVEENVISNIMKGVSLLNLSGMTAEGEAEGVTIWRPLLPHNKVEIFTLAHKYGIPYFKDTTPKWSNRGRMRNELMPLLSEFRDMAGRSVFGPFFDALKSSPVAVWVECGPFAHHPLAFWKEALRRICEEKLGIGRVAERSTIAFMEAIGRAVGSIPTRTQKAKVDAFVPIKKDVKAMIRSSELIIFRPSLFKLDQKTHRIETDNEKNVGEVKGESMQDRRARRRKEKKSGQHKKPKKTLHVDDEVPVEIGKTYEWGPWTVSVSIADVSLLKERNKVSLREFLSGEFSYYLPVAEVDVISGSETKLQVNRSIKIKQLQGIATGQPARAILDAIPAVVNVTYLDNSDDSAMASSPSSAVKVTYKF
ncbi:hypothetical protein AAMO2058_001325900 [Amorphochlora amoebiformis]